MKRNMLKVLVLSVPLIVAATSSAAVHNYVFPLSGLNEVPPNASPATGTANVLFDDASNQLSWSVAYAGLTAPLTASHFHGPALPGVNAGVQVPVPIGPSPMVGGPVVLTAVQEADLLAGLWYLNLHTTQFPGGEIRGQVVPEPAAALLLGVGALLSLRSRRTSR